MRSAARPETAAPIAKKSAMTSPSLNTKPPDPFQEPDTTKKLEGAQSWRPIEIRKTAAGLPTTVTHAPHAGAAATEKATAPDNAECAEKFRNLLSHSIS